MYIEVVVPVNLNQTFFYKLDPSLGEVRVGGIVYVNFNGRDIHAVVINLLAQVDPKIKRVKPVLKVVNPQYFGAELLKSLKFASNYYIASLGNTLFAALPPLYRTSLPKVSSFYLVKYEFSPSIFNLISIYFATKITSLLELNLFIENSLLGKESSDDFANLAMLLSAPLSANERTLEFKTYLKDSEINLTIFKLILNLVQSNYFLYRLKTKYPYLTSNEELSLDSLTYHEILQLSKQTPKVNQNSKSFEFLVSQQLINLESTIVTCQSASIPEFKQRASKWFAPYQNSPIEDIHGELINQGNKLQLNAQQQQVYQEVTRATGYNAYLLDGVTGSGKTEVYLQIIEYYLLQGKSCLVLVPEIGLTPQTVSRFKNRFNVKIGIIHSNIDDESKNQLVKECLNGEISILIGTRSAVFMQMQNLGCIILDEEHDSSYKQQNDFRYNARDLAAVRANNLQVPIVMGSATPSFTSLYNVAINKYKHLILSRRAATTNENKTIILDIRKQDFVGIEDKRVLLNKAGITVDLWNLMQEELGKNNQVLLFLNRRGYAPQLVCHDCGYIFLCPDCDRPLTYHRRKHELHCHNCGIRFSHIPDHCPSCNSTFLEPLGAGTEQIEKLCANLYASDKIIRIDRDTAKNSGELEYNLNRAHNTAGAILIGTQMLAKGHHFADVTLVALLNIDGLMLSEDYRSSERLAQLYVQVAGRAGRESKPGMVVLQTAMPHEKIYHDLLTLSYFNFANLYLQIRRDLNYPPFTHQAYLALRHQNQEIVVLLAQELMKLLTQTINEYGDGKLANSVNLYDVGKQNKLHKFVIDFIVADRKARNEILQKVNREFYESELYKRHRPIFYIDVDPYDLN
ncbi:primosomal protein N' [Psittacicella hinzii]|uniref:Replication restart protein PriA n=1 Tax=Psittacicella hinzii TaxID=2028575 RepID=A0A3A1Y9Z6_9GAMM|nr:primosomal protein N' [Psittacicella hinzii]RIY34146.1 primosomal protein N' [Psittacicella hinzii]